MAHSAAGQTVSGIAGPRGDRWVRAVSAFLGAMLVIIGVFTVLGVAMGHIPV